MKEQVNDTDIEPEVVRKVLAVAALFNNEFNIDWLQELTSEKASLVLGALDIGIQNKWLSHKKQGVFYFTDGRERDKRVSPMPLKEKVSLHKRIAELLQRELPDGPDMVESIAPHLLFFPNNLDGCRILIDFGKLQENNFQHDNARQAYGRALEDLRLLPGKDAASLFIQAAIHYARVCMDEIGVDGTVSIIEEALDLAQSEKDDNSLALLELHLAKNEWLRDRLQTARLHFTRGRALALKSEDPKIRRSGEIFNLFFCYWMGKYRELIQHYEKFAPDIENFPKKSIPLLASITAGACYGFCGQPSQGLGMLDAIRSHSQHIGNLYVASHAGIAIGELFAVIRSFEESREYLEESLKEARRCHNIFPYVGGLFLLSYVYYKLNDQKKAYAALCESIELRKRLQVRIRHGFVRMGLAWGMEEGALPRHEDLDLKEEIRDALQGGNVFSKGQAYRYRAFLKRRESASAHEIITDLKRSVKYLTESGNPIEIAFSKMELAREYLRIGDEKTARIWAKPAVGTLLSLNQNLVPDDIGSLIAAKLSKENLLDEILHLGQELATIRDSRNLFRSIISSINRITGAERGAIFLAPDHDTHTIVLRAAKNLTAEDVEMPDFEDSMNLIRETFRTGKGLVRNFDDQRKDNPPWDSSAIRSCICIPMNIRSKIVGVLYHDNRIFRSSFEKTDLNILHYFAAQAAIAMDNVHAWQAFREMFEKQQKEKDYYESQYLQCILSEDFIGESRAIVKVFNEIEQVANTNATVLITGETGVGKELVARSIHNHSPRKNKPFIRVHCSALPESLISNELFGHEKGSFTGAHTRQIGRFELADGGTLFLDEIGDIPMEIQTKLLRVLQSREFERIGGKETIHSDFRLLAATNKDLQSEVRAGRFRQDLYYRLHIFPIHVPPLRKRKEDIPLLVKYFLNAYAAQYGKPIKEISKIEMEKLLHYEWPGNVRELENLVERGVIVSKGDDFKAPDLERRHATSLNEPWNVTLEENERRHIIRVLKNTGGKIAGKGGAAEILAIPPSTLNSRMKKLGIQRHYHLL